MPLLVKVEEVFVARGRGVLVEPRFAPAAIVTGPFAVTLRLPDGTERTTSASMETSHMRGALVPWAMLRLPELSVDDVPAGTEVWTEDSASRCES